jgi:transcriptional regulator with XRE-family HTH domain
MEGAMSRPGRKVALRDCDVTPAREFAQSRQFSSRDLGKLTGISHMHVWRLLAGRRPITEAHAAAIAAALGVSVDSAFPRRQEAADAAD